MDIFNILEYGISMLEYGYIQHSGVWNKYAGVCNEYGYIQHSGVWFDNRFK